MAFVYQGDSELESKSKKAAERISENMHIVANEPSLALYRLQEHVRKALPPMVERRVEVTKLQHELQGRCYDVEYALSHRASKFTEDEIMLFQKLLKKYRATILCKKTGKVNPKEREMSWEKLTAEFNGNPGVTKQRSVVQMKNKWDYMKRLAKKEAAAFKKAQEAPDGSPPAPLNDTTIFLIDTIRGSMEGFEHENDSCDADAFDDVSEMPKQIEEITIEPKIEDMSCGSTSGSTNINVIDYSQLNGELEIKVKVEPACHDEPEVHQNILPHSPKQRRLQFNETTARYTRAKYMEMTERKKIVEEKLRRKENEKKLKLELEILKKKSDNMSIEQEKIRLECQVQREELEIKQLMKKKLELELIFLQKNLSDNKK